MQTDFQGKKVGILGFGVNNAELVPLLKERGAQVTICDMDSNMAQDIPGVEYRLGDSYLDNLDSFDSVFRTPRIPYLNPKLQAAKAAGVEITSQTQLFLDECPCRVIGVTGTKGKGTTSSLIEACLKAAKANNDLQGNIYLAGNIGVSPISYLEHLTPDDWVILELSSFQLHGLTKSPHIGVLLNITQDHLDHHQSVDEYQQAKSSIVRYQTGDDYAVVYTDSVITMGMLDITHAQPYFYSGNHPVIAGCYVKDDLVLMRMFADSDTEICTAQNIKLVGHHNLENISAAASAARLAGVSVESIQQAVQEFEGLEYRLQLVGEKNGIKYYNDSFATQPDATIVAIQSFTQPITIILGGSSKGADFTHLVSAIKESTVKNIVYIGQEGQKLAALLKEANVPQKLIPGGESMIEIVNQATEAASSGEIVLLSPACASLGMFKDYKDRGKQFTNAAKGLA